MEIQIYKTKDENGNWVLVTPSMFVVKDNPTDDDLANIPHIDKKPTLFEFVSFKEMKENTSPVCKLNRKEILCVSLTDWLKRTNDPIVIALVMLLVLNQETVKKVNFNDLTDEDFANIAKALYNIIDDEKQAILDKIIIERVNKIIAEQLDMETKQ